MNPVVNLWSPHGRGVFVHTIHNCIIDSNIVIPLVSQTGLEVSLQSTRRTVILRQYMIVVVQLKERLFVRRIIQTILGENTFQFWWGGGQAKLGSLGGSRVPVGWIITDVIIQGLVIIFWIARRGAEVIVVTITFIFINYGRKKLWWIPLVTVTDKNLHMPLTRRETTYFGETLHPDSHLSLTATV